MSRPEGGPEISCETDSDPTQGASRLGDGAVGRNTAALISSSSAPVSARRRAAGPVASADRRTGPARVDATLYGSAISPLGALFLSTQSPIRAITLSSASGMTEAGKHAAHRWFQLRSARKERAPSSNRIALAV